MAQQRPEQNKQSKPMRIPATAFNLLVKVALLRATLGMEKRSMSEDCGVAIEEWATKVIEQLEKRLREQGGQLQRLHIVAPITPQLVKKLSRTCVVREQQ